MVVIKRPDSVFADPWLRLPCWGGGVGCLPRRAIFPQFKSTFKLLYGRCCWFSVLAKADFGAGDVRHCWCWSILCRVEVFVGINLRCIGGAGRPTRYGAGTSFLRIMCLVRPFP